MAVAVVVAAWVGCSAVASLAVAAVVGRADRTSGAAQEPSSRPVVALAAVPALPDAL